MDCFSTLTLVARTDSNIGLYFSQMYYIGDKEKDKEKEKEEKEPVDTILCNLCQCRIAVTEIDEHSGNCNSR